MPRLNGLRTSPKLERLERIELVSSGWNWWNSCIAWLFHLNTIMKVYVSCETCKSSFQAEQKEINRGYGRFCSRTCSANRDRRSAETNCVCANCTQHFYRSPSKLRNSKSGILFCSRNCKDEAQRIGGIKEIQPPHYNNGTRNYRDICFRIHGSKCAGCGYDKHNDVVTVHHRDCDRSNNDPINLVPLCPTCHVEVHHGHRDV